MTPVDQEWMSELDLDPSSPWLKMGTRSLGSRSWLVSDQKSEAELAQRATLLDQKRDLVFATCDEAFQASQEVYELVSSATGLVGDPTIADPLERSGRMVQEDFVLLRFRDQSWFLDAACLCFPSRWRLGDKVGRPMMDIHGPVGGYPDGLADKVNMMMGRLGARPVWRRNWFVHPNGALFQPSGDDDSLVGVDDCGTGLFVRSERQTLRRLVASDWILFTIRIEHCALNEFLIDAERTARFTEYVSQASASDLDHRGMSPDQVMNLRNFLSRLGPNN